MFDAALKLALEVGELAPLHGGRDGSVEVSMSHEQWVALRAVLLNLRLVDLLKQQEIIRVHPKLVAACQAALSVEGLPTPVRKQLEKALALAEF